MQPFYERHNRTLTCIILLVTCLLLLARHTHAQWKEIPNRGTTVDFAGTFTDQANAFTGTAIHARENYWAGVQGTQIAADGKIKSQDLATRAQGGRDIEFLGVSAQFFIEATRGMDTELATATGGYIRKVLEVDKLDLIFGVGSFVEREQVRADLGLDKTAPTVLPYYLWSVGAEVDLTDTVGLHTRLIATPESRFSHWRGTVDFGTDIVLSDRWTLKFQSTTQFKTDAGADRKTTEVETENSLILSLNL